MLPSTLESGREYSVLTFDSTTTSNHGGPPVPYRSSEITDSSYVDLKPAETEHEQINVDAYMVGDNLVRIILPSGQVCGMSYLNYF